MNAVQQPDSFEAADYTGVLRRRWWIVLLCTIIGLVAAFGYVTVAPKAYTATASVNVVPTASDQSNVVAGSRTAGATVNLDTEAQVVSSTTVSAIAGKMMHSPLTAWALAQQVNVTVPPNSSILDISCKASTPEGAAACANAFAKAYLQNRSQSAANYINQQLVLLQKKITGLNQAKTALITKLKSLPANSPTKAADQALLKTDQSQIAKLTQKYAATSALAAQTNGGSIISPATPPGKPSSPKKLLILPSGLIAGLLIGLVTPSSWTAATSGSTTPRTSSACSTCPCCSTSLPERSAGRSPSPPPGPRPGRSSPTWATGWRPRSARATMSCSWPGRRPARPGAWSPPTWPSPWPGRTPRWCWSAPT